MCVCVYVHASVCVYMYTYTVMYVCTYVYACIRMCENKNMYITQEYQHKSVLKNQLIYDKKDLISQILILKAYRPLSQVSFLSVWLKIVLRTRRISANGKIAVLNFVIKRFVLVITFIRITLTICFMWVFLGGCNLNRLVFIKISMFLFYQCLRDIVFVGDYNT